MSKKSDIRSRNVAITAYRMSQRGCTHKFIAEHLGKKPHQIKSLILLGERLESLNEETTQ